MSGEPEIDANAIRQLEVEAYSALISSFYAQGELTWRKEQLLQEARWALKISDDLHRRELQRIHADPNLAQIRNNSVKEQYFPGVTPLSRTAEPSEATEQQNDSVSQTRRLNVYPAARTLKGEPLSVPGNIVSRPPPIENPKPLSPVTNRKPRPRPARKPATPKVTPKKKQVIGSPTEPKVQSITLIVDEELQNLQITKAKLEETKELIARELIEIEKQSLQASTLVLEEDEEDSESQSEDEEGESGEEDSEDEENVVGQADV